MNIDSSQHECQCLIGEICSRRNRVISPIHQAKCKQGYVEAVDRIYLAFDESSAADGEMDDEKPSPNPGRQRNVDRRNSGERVGSALAAKIEGLLKVKGGSGCGCSTLASKMDAWGIVGCEKRRDEIVSALVANRDMLVKALNSGSFFLHAVGISASVVPDMILEIGANWLLNSAIKDTRQHVLAKAESNLSDSCSETSLTQKLCRQRGKD